MTMDDEHFFAWLDGELDEAEAAAVAAHVAANPELQRKAAQHGALNSRLQFAFAPVASAPVPDAILAPTQSGTVIDLSTARERRASRLQLPAVAQWAAIAATLVLGLVTGSMLGGGSSTSVRGQSGQLLASAELDSALNVRLASAPAATGPRIGLTFRDRSGSICRSFSDGPAQGLACRSGDDWVIRGLIQSEATDSGQFRMAAGSDPMLADLITSRIVGEPFDAEAERRAQAGGWR